MIGFKDWFRVPMYIKYLGQLSKNLCWIFISDDWKKLKQLNAKYVKLKHFEFNRFTKEEAVNYILQQYHVENNEFAAFFKENQ